MDLKSFLVVIWRRRLVIGIAAALALIVTTAGLFLITPEYVASTTLRMGTANTGASGWVSYDIQYTDRLMNTYRTMVISQQTSDEVMKQLNLSAPPLISVNIPANTELMEILVKDQSPKHAADAANAVAKLLVTQIDAQYASLGESSLEILKQQIDQIESDLIKQRADYNDLLQQSPQNKDQLNATLQSIQLNESTYSSLLTQYQQMRDATAQGASKMTVVQEASTPTTPSNPNKKILIPLGLMLGLIGGTGLAFLLENFDTTMHTTEEIAELVELPVIGRIPETQHASGSVLFPEKSPQEEAFRRLRTTLFALDPDAAIRSVMITSSQPAEGKSTTVANLALAIAQAGRRVIVVDGDLRKPAIHRIFKVSNSVGLSTVLTRDVTLDEAIQYSMIPGVQVLTSGPASPTPAELLGLPEMQDVVAELSKQFDFVLIDAPSLQTVADATVLSLIVDGVYVVVARGTVRRETVDAALKGLAGIHRTPVGIIVSRAESSTDFHYDRPADGGPGSISPKPPVPAKEAQRTAPVLRIIPPIVATSVVPEPSKPDFLRSVSPDDGPKMSEISSQPEEVILRRIKDARRFYRKNGGSRECFENDTRMASER